MWKDLTSDVRKVFDTVLPAYALLEPLIHRDSVVYLGVSPDAKTAAILTESAEDLAELRAFDCFEVRGPRNTDAEMVTLKHGAIGDVTRPITNAWLLGQKMLGGPNALTSTLVGSALGGLGGYAVGRVYDKVVPPVLRAVVPGGEEYIGESQMGKTLGLLGAGLGAMPGAIHMGTSAATGHSILDNYPWSNDQPFVSKQGNDAWIPSIPVDAFNRVVWSDSMQPQNPFGTRSAWGDNEQPMRTPPGVATAVTGLLAAASAGAGSDTVSPWDVARVAARVGMNAGMGAVGGAAAGLVAGKVLGALAGLQPAAQDKLRQTGLWSGLLTGIARTIF